MNDPKSEPEPCPVPGRLPAEPAERRALAAELIRTLRRLRELDQAAEQVRQDRYETLREAQQRYRLSLEAETLAAEHEQRLQTLTAEPKPRRAAKEAWLLDGFLD